MTRLEAFEQEIRRRGLRMTPQRRLIFRSLCACGDHPTAEEVFRAVRRDDPGISLATIYNTLETLVGMGQIEVLPGHNGVRRYDPNPERHHHLRCVGCGALEDVAVSAGESVPLPRPAGSRACRVLGYRIEYLGHCPRCKAGRRGSRRRASSAKGRGAARSRRGARARS